MENMDKKFSAVGDIYDKLEMYKSGEMSFDKFFEEMQKYKKSVLKNGEHKAGMEIFDKIASQALEEEERRKGAGVV